MKVELRITRLDQLQQIKNLPFDIIGIGNEYCAHKLCNVEEIEKIICECNKIKKKFRIVTAFLTDETFDRVFNTITYLSEKYENLEVVINDYGLLKKTQEIILKNNIQILIGQMLAHSMEEFIWVNNIVGKENKFIKRSVLLNGFANSVVLEYFKKYNLKSIILNYLPYGMISADYIKSFDVGVSFVDKYYTMAVARKCHIAKFNSILPSENCQKLCDKGLLIDISKEYNISDLENRYKLANEDLKGKVTKWPVFGNAILNLYKNELDLSKYYNDEIILDIRFYENLSDLTNAIKKYK